MMTSHVPPGGAPPERAPPERALSHSMAVQRPHPSTPYSNAKSKTNGESAETRSKSAF